MLMGCKESNKQTIHMDISCLLTDEINVRRRPAAMPNGAIIDTATVASSTADEYEVTLKPFECGDEFPLLELANAQVH